MELFDVSAVQSQIEAAEEMSRAAGLPSGSKRKEAGEEETKTGAAGKVEDEREVGMVGMEDGPGAKSAHASGSGSGSASADANPASTSVTVEMETKAVFGDAPDWPGIRRYTEMVSRLD